VTETIDIVRTLKRRVTRHNAPIFAAAVAFFAFLALIPALTAVIGVYGLVADPTDVTRELTDALSRAPESTRQFLVEQMTDIAAGSSGVLGLSVGVSLAIALFSASGAVANLLKSLNVAYEIEETRTPWRLRGTALGLMIGSILVLGVVMFLTTALPAMLSRWGFGGTARLALNIGRYPVLGMVMASSLSLLYRLGPDHRGNDKPMSPRLFTAGGLVATVLFVVLSALFSFYTANLGSYGETYGPLATIIVLLLWFQLSALSVIVGAELDAELADRAWRDRSGLESLDARADSAAGAAAALYAAMGEADADAVSAIWHRHGAWHHPLFGELAVPDQLDAHLRGLFASFPDLVVDAAPPSGRDDEAVVRYRLRGTFTGDAWVGHEANGRDIDIDVASFVRVEDGFVVRVEEIFDTDTVAKQLGFRPGDTSAAARIRLGVDRLRSRINRR
jgi:membrane protein